MVCNNSSTPVPLIPASAYYSNTSGVLLLDSEHKRCLIVHQRNSNMWSLPKGHSQGCENEIETSFRELFEETGIYLPNHRYKYHGKISISPRVKNSGCVCVCSIKSDYSNLDISNTNDVNEIDCVKWVDIKLLLNNDIYHLNRFSNILINKYQKLFVVNGKKNYNFFQNNEQYSVQWRQKM